MKRLILVLAFSLIGLTVLTACSEPDISEAEAEIKEEIEDLEVTITDLSYDTETQVLLAEFETNVPEGTEVDLKLYTPEYGYLTHDELVVGKVGAIHHVEFDIPTYSLEDIITGSYVMETEIVVNYEEDYNTHLHSGKLGGYGDDLLERYEDSETVEVELGQGFSILDFAVFIKSNEYEIEIAQEEQVEEEVVVEESFSADFLLYNTKYYTAFKNQLDLVGSNFEILAMDGFGNQNIVDDLVMWTNDFNELLDVYETDSIPVNDVDQELHSLTLAMIAEQRKANENILNGLQQVDESYFFMAEDHLYTVGDLYMKGYNLLD